MLLLDYPFFLLSSLFIVPSLSFCQFSTPIITSCFSSGSKSSSSRTSIKVHKPFVFPKSCCIVCQCLSTHSYIFDDCIPMSSSFCLWTFFFFIIRVALSWTSLSSFHLFNLNYCICILSIHDVFLLLLRETHSTFQLPAFSFLSFFCQPYPEYWGIRSKKLFYRPSNT